MANARKICFDALFKTYKDGAYSNIIASKLANMEYEDSRDKAFVCKLYYGVVERQITIDYIISLFSKQKISRKKSVLIYIFQQSF